MYCGTLTLWVSYEACCIACAFDVLNFGALLLKLNLHGLQDSAGRSESSGRDALLVPPRKRFGQRMGRPEDSDRKPKVTQQIFVCLQLLRPPVKTLEERCDR